MVYTAQDLFNKSETARKMYYLIEKYYKDLKSAFIKINGKNKPLLSLSLNEFFNYVKNIPYRRDRKPIEVIARPKHILKHQLLGMDCKKKSILISSFLRNKKYPYRLVGSSSKKNGKIHHVFPQVSINGQWYNVDATYDYNKLYGPKKVTNYELL